MAQQTLNNRQDEKQRALGLALGQIEKQYGKGAIMRLGESQALDVPAISTGSLALDAALGVGGVPRGRIIEIFGPEASGKTTLALHIIASAQRARWRGGLCGCGTCARSHLCWQARSQD